MRVEKQEEEKEANRWPEPAEEEGRKEIGIAVVVAIETTLSDASATDVSSLVSSSTTKPPPIPNGFPVLAIGSAPVL